ncbi:MAG: hypothetical protein JXA41_08045 [Deltaproteobacteria bacterium]|nr:hypothetical protein [Deltaproteobacteria bacterium]
MNELKQKKHNFGNSVIVYEGAQIDKSVTIGPFSIIYPNTIIDSGVKIASSCIIGKPPTVGKNQMPLMDSNSLTQIGSDVYIGDQSIIYAGVQIGENTYLADRSFLREDVKIENDVVIGTGVVVSFGAAIGSFTKIMTGANIGGQARIGRNCFIGVHVCSINDNTPQTLKPREKQLSADIGNGVFIGSNTTILPGLKVSDNITVGAGSVITKSLDHESSLYIGSPAKFIKIINASG